MTGGDIYTIAGNGLVSFSGDRGPALRAQFGVDPEIGLPVAVDGTGNLLVSDRANLRVRLVAARSGVLFGRRMLAGYVYTLAYCAKIACLPGLAAFDRAGNAVVATNVRIEVIAARSGTYYGQAMKAGSTYVIAGGGTADANGVPDTKAALQLSEGLAVDGHGNVLTDCGPLRGDGPYHVRVVAASSGSFYGKAMRAGYVYALTPAGVVYAVDNHGNVLIGGDYQAPPAPSTATR